MLDSTELAGIGHNHPPALPYDLAKFQLLELRAREIADAGADWIKLPSVDSEEHAGKANDFLAQVKSIEKETEAERKKQKAPHDAAGKAVDAAFKGLLAPLGKIADGVKPKLLDFARRKAAEEAAEKARLADEARQKQEEAARLAAQAEERGDVFGQAAAEEAAKDAEKMAKAAAKETKTQVKSATGGGRTMAMRTTWKVDQITNMNQAFSFFRDHERYGTAVRELFTRMAEAERRAVDGVNEIPGITFKEVETIA